ncbi:MAG TPA: ATP-binding cassette domain-containing protein [Trebonia sp.]|nr:ATP-binding cassette domain-containing protein [Trebonia sp.]
MLVQAAIEARAITCRTRAGVVTVRDISLTAGQGELVGIIGGSGSGKQTLLDALSGRCPPTSGTVRRHPGRRAGYVPAVDSLPQVLPLARALRYTAALRGAGDLRWRRGAVSPGDNGDAVDEALGLVGLAGAAAAAVGTLNPGERKRAEIAAELLAAPAALFLDEPATGLDPAQATQVLRLLRGLSDTGITVLLTTSSSLDAARCDKIAVLAVGGHLAFFGTPAAARGYFGADSLEEIYECLSGLGDPAAAWSRRFFYFSRTAAVSAPVPATPCAPGPALLIPDQAGPHSAGRPSPLPQGDPAPGDWNDLEPGYRNDQSSASGRDPGARHERDLTRKPARQLPVLVRRDAEVLARARRRQVILAAVPVAVLVVFCVLLGAGALDGPAAVTLAWAVLGGLVTGLAYELPVRTPEAGVLRRERFNGLSLPAFLAAKAALLVPALALADLVILAVPAAAARLQAGFGISYLTVFVASAIGLTAATITLFPGTA